MGTTLTGTTPQDTYDSLIKVTDNGPLSGSLKVLTDGLGNNSTLSLSTTAASIAGTLAVTGAATLSSTITASGIASLGIGQTTELAYIGDRTTVNTRYIKFERASALTDIVNIQGVNGGVGSTDIALQAVGGNVGIGTSAPNVQLEVSAADNSLGGIFRLNNNRTALFDGDQNGSIQFSNNEASGGASGVRSSIVSLIRDTAGASDIVFNTASSNGAASERIRILAGGGLTFNGDTAAANALDDYEEGTWTIGVSFGDTSVGVTYAYNTGTYTKIGRQVTVNGILILTNKGTSTGAAKITGLPYTIGSTIPFYVSATLRLTNITFANQFQGFGSTGTTLIELNEITEAGAVTNLTNADFSNNSDVMVSLTYFV